MKNGIEGVSKVMAEKCRGYAVVLKATRTKSVEDLKNVISYLYQNPREIVKMRESKKKALKYSWRQFGNQVIKILEESSCV